MAAIALAALLAACSGVSTDGTLAGDPAGTLAGGDAASGDRNALAIGGDELIGLCGGTVITPAAVAAAEPRLTDAVITAFDAAGLLLAAPERWVAVRSDPTSTVIVDPVPLSTEPLSYWVRATVAGVGVTYDGPCVPAFGPPDAGGPLPASCSASPVPGGIVVTWPDAGPVGVRRDGQPVAVVAGRPTQIDGATDDAIDDAWADRLAEHTDTAVGPIPLRAFADPIGTGLAHHYTLTYGALDDPDGEVDCGAVEASPAGETEAARPATGAVGSDDRNALVAAADALAADVSLQYPYHYVTIEPICNGCDGRTIDLYLVPGDKGHVVERLWVDGVDTPIGQAGLWATDPLLVAELLLAADGGSATWRIDPATQLVVEWTLEGEGARLVCIEADNRPLTMRPDEGCGDFNRLGG